jgi:O-antigen ligase
MGFNLYLVFVTSWFLHLGTRIPLLGLIRFDLMLVAVLTILALLGRARQLQNPTTDTDRWLRVLIIYSIVTIPLVEWPGSVIWFGIEALVKGVVFYYFTIAFVDSEARLKKFIAVFVGCQLLRVMEPLYLHVTEGYWGSIASMANWEYLNRLSGAPSDVVNPNGLAFIVCTVLPFLWFAGGLSRTYRLILLIFAPLCVYALMLTGSRSGFVGLIVVVFGIFVKVKQRFALAVGCVLVAVIAFPLLGSDMQDRYLSIVGLGSKNEASVVGRITGIIDNFEVALRRPFFGHGLGTSREANGNFGESDQPAHNLYAELATELGFIGMVIFIFLIVSIYSSFQECKRAYTHRHSETVLSRVVDAMQVWLLLNIVFSFASYGLTSYEWYLLGGLAVVLPRLAVQRETVSNDDINRTPGLRGPSLPSVLPEAHSR